MTNSVLTDFCLIAMVITVATSTFHAVAHHIDYTLFGDDE